MTEGKRWVVTGASGYLGSHVVEQLLASGETVTAIDKCWDNGNADFLKQFDRNEGFSRHCIDIVDSESVVRVLSSEKPDFCVHLAAIHFIPACCADPFGTINTNVLGTQSVLTACRKANVGTFWFASTGDVYSPVDTPLIEDVTPVEPFNIYGLSKSICEQLIQLESRERANARFFVGRLFNLYGPRETNPHFLPEVIKQIVANPDKPLRLGSLWPKRDMVPVADAARAVIASARCAPQGLSTMNVATGHAISMREILDLVGEVLGKPLLIELDESRVRKVERKHLQADVARIKQLIGWAPHSDTRTAIEQLVRYETSAVID